jgi:hypothetical protein
MPCISVHREIHYQFPAPHHVSQGVHVYRLPPSPHTRWESFSLHQFHPSNHVEIVEPARVTLVLATNDGVTVDLQVIREARGTVALWNPVIAYCADPAAIPPMQEEKGEDADAVGYYLAVIPAADDAILRLTVHGHVYPETPHHSRVVMYHEGKEIVCVHEEGRGDSLWSIPIDPELPTLPT